MQQERDFIAEEKKKKITSCVFFFWGVQHEGCEDVSVIAQPDQKKRERRSSKAQS